MKFKHFFLKSFEDTMTFFGNFFLIHLFLEQDLKHVDVKTNTNLFEID